MVTLPVILGKWHHGLQTERPGFDTVATFYGQGSYFSTKFYDGHNNLIRTTSNSEWVDDVSTDYAINFIEEQYNAKSLSHSTWIQNAPRTF